MKIESKEQASAAIEAVCEWFREELTRYYTALESDDEVPRAPSDPMIDTMAREFCSLLLNASNAGGMSGCPMCQS